MSTIRWGIAATGGIAGTFAEGMNHCDGGQVTAVGSRTQDRAAAFAAEHGIDRAHGSYEALAADGEIDAVYVATTQQRHRSDTEMFLDAGKHVLCEKPLALSGGQVTSMIDAAERNGRVLAEALWSRSLPGYLALAEVLAAGEIGEPLHVEASFGFRIDPIDPTHRLFDPAQGGGALLDLGIYPIQLAMFVLGHPDRIAAVGTIGETGVDVDSTVALGFPSGATAGLRSAIRVNYPCDATIVGTAGSIDIAAFAHCPQSFVVNAAGASRTVEAPMTSTGLQHQVPAFQDAIAANALDSTVIESAAMPHAESVELARITDEVRRQIGMRYPTE